MGADYSFYAKTIETHDPTFFKVVIFSIGSVTSFCFLEQLKTPKGSFEINWPIESRCYTDWWPSFLKDVDPIDQSLAAVSVLILTDIFLCWL